LIPIIMYLLCLFQMGVVLVFRFHYIVDVITALFAAFFSDYLGRKTAPAIENYFNTKKAEELKGKESPKLKPNNSNKGSKSQKVN